YLEKSKARLLAHELARKTREAKAPAEDAAPERSRLINAIQKRLPSDTTIVEYSINHEETQVFILSAESFHHVALPLSENKIAALTDVFLDHLQNQQLDEGRRAGKELYKLLILPLKPYLKPNSTLCIIPDGRLFFIPFPALITETERFLIED